MKYCQDCGNSISETNVSGRCRSCAQKAAVPKREATCLQRYGAKNVMHLETFIKKIQYTFTERYGVKCAMDVPEYKQKQAATTMKRYGVPAYVLTSDYVHNSHFRESVAQKHVAKLLNEHGVKTSSELVLDDKKFDIAIVGIPILLEIDPTYTHNIIGNHWNKHGIDERYHLMKTAVAGSHEYSCIHVFDWDNIEDIIDRLTITCRIYARNCTTSFEHTDTCIYAKLIHLESVVLSATIQRSSVNNYDYEITSIHFEKHLQVVGGVSKLIKHIAVHLNTSKIFIKWDISKYSSCCLEHAGMKLVATIDPVEHWSRGHDVLDHVDSEDVAMLIQTGWLPVYDCGYAIYSFVDGFETQPSKQSLKQYYQDIANQIMKSKERLCDFCGLPFVPASNRQRYCKRTHERVCPICGKPYVEDNVENLKRPPVACSYECRVKKTQQTSMKLYGCPAPGNTVEARKKANETRARNRQLQ